MLLAIRHVLVSFVLLVSIASVRAETAVDLELVLAVDISLSMDTDEQRLQRGGYIAALRDPDVLNAIQAGPHGRIAITYIEWAGPHAQIVLIPWRLIDGPTSAEAFVAELSANEHSRHYWTSISAALAFSYAQFAVSTYRAARRVIDISGDGVNNSGPNLAPVRDMIVRSGIVINGLPILLKRTLELTPYDAPDLDVYYSHCVIGGTGSFMIPIRSRAEFAVATRRKLLLEISGTVSKPRPIPAQLGWKERWYDCGVLERQ